MSNETLLREMEEQASQYHVPILQPAGRQVLLAAVRQKRPERVLEIGTAIGYSTLLIGQEMDPQGEIISIDIDEQRQAQAAQFIGRADLPVTVRLLTGDALPVIAKLTGSFDFVFIDAAKGQYIHYLDAVLGMLQPGAVVVADNVLFRGLVQSDQPVPRRFRTIVKRLRQYLEKVSASGLFTTEIFAQGDGLAVSIYQGPILVERD